MRRGTKGKFAIRAIDNADDDAQRRLSEGFNSLIVIASPPVAHQLIKFDDFIRIDRQDEFSNLV